MNKDWLAIGNQHQYFESSFVKAILTCNLSYYLPLTCKGGVCYKKMVLLPCRISLSSWFHWFSKEQWLISECCKWHIWYGTWRWLWQSQGTETQTKTQQVTQWGSWSEHWHSCWWGPGWPCLCWHIARSELCQIIYILHVVLAISFIFSHCLL